MSPDGPGLNPAKAQIFEAGATIMRQGEPGSSAYVVVDGVADVLVGETRVATVGPGGIVGEMAVLTGQPRSATVIARTKCWLAPIDSEQFADLVQHNPHFSLQVMTQMSERMAERARLTGEEKGT
ncbi:MAG: cyclic nucleotide-binding domain-containing protein [Chloroflexi bacterium]|nr:cyclic nucleotide-binding domain-containing protein [Chloroflexota bacterium]